MDQPTIQLVNTGQIRPGDNDRREFKQRDLQTLADSIRDNRLAQPITVRPAWECEAETEAKVAERARMRATARTRAGYSELATATSRRWVTATTKAG